MLAGNSKAFFSIYWIIYRVYMVNIVFTGKQWQRFLHPCLTQTGTVHWSQCQPRSRLFHEEDPLPNYWQTEQAHRSGCLKQQIGRVEESFCWKSLAPSTHDQEVLLTVDRGLGYCHSLSPFVDCWAAFCLEKRQFRLLFIWGRTPSNHSNAETISFLRSGASNSHCYYNWSGWVLSV